MTPPLLDHNVSRPPFVRCIKVSVDNDALLSRLSFSMKETCSGTGKVSIYRFHQVGNRNLSAKSDFCKIEMYLRKLSHLGKSFPPDFLMGQE